MGRRSNDETSNQTGAAPHSFLWLFVVKCFYCIGNFVSFATKRSARVQSASGACYAPTEVKRRRTAAERKMSLKRPTAGGEFRKRNSFLLTGTEDGGLYNRKGAGQQ